MKNTRLDKLEAKAMPPYDMPLMVYYLGKDQYSIGAFYPDPDPPISGDELQAILDKRNTGPNCPNVIIVDSREREDFEYTPDFPAYKDPEYPRYKDKDDPGPRDFD